MSKYCILFQIQSTQKEVPEQAYENMPGENYLTEGGSSLQSEESTSINEKKHYRKKKHSLSQM